MSSDKDLTAWVESLKVADLKEELKKRGLSTTGLKAILAERLLSFVQEEKGEPGKAEAPETKDVNEPPATDDVDVGKQDHAGNLQPEQPAEVEEVKKSDSDVLARNGQQQESPAATPAEVADAPKGATEAFTVHSILDADAEPVDYGEADHEETEPEPGPQPSKAPSESADIEEKQQARPSPGKQPVEPTEAAPTSGPEPAPTSQSEEPTSDAAAQQDGQNKKRRAPIPLYQPRDKSQQPEATPVAASPNERPAKQAKTAAGARPSMEVADKLHGASAIPANATAGMRINNLVRPFTENQLRELLGQTGTIKDMWMPSIKTHAFIMFETVEQAEATYQAVNNMKWPRDSPKLLSPVFMTVEECELEILQGKDPKAAAAKKVAMQQQAQGSGAGTAPEGNPALARKGSQQLGAAAKASSPHTDNAQQGSKRTSEAKPMPMEEDEPVKSLNDLFRKTITKPAVYWLALTDAEVVEKKKKEQEEEEQEEKKNQLQQRISADAGPDAPGRRSSGRDELPLPPSLPPPPPRAHRDDFGPLRGHRDDFGPPRDYRDMRDRGPYERRGRDYGRPR